MKKINIICVISIFFLNVTETYAMIDQDLHIRACFDEYQECEVNCQNIKNDFSPAGVELEDEEFGNGNNPYNFCLHSCAQLVEECKRSGGTWK